MSLLQDRSDISPSDTWNLDPLYSSEAAWQSDFEVLEGELSSISSFREILGRTSGDLEGVLKRYFSQYRLAEKLYTFAHLRSDEDVRNSQNLGRLDKIRNLYARFSAEWSFLTPGILAIDDTTMSHYLGSEELQPYQRVLHEILRYKPHTLSSSEETILAAASEALSASERIYSQLNNADLRFGVLRVGDTDQELSHGSYQVVMKNQDRSIREKAFRQYYQCYEDHKNTIAATLTTSIQRDLFLMRTRRYNNTKEAALFTENMPMSVYDNLITTVSQGLPALHRYYRLRKNILGFEKLCSYDLSVPLVAEVQKTTSYEEACSLVLQSLHPLGEEYQTVLGDGLLNGRWVDRYENRGKRSGAYSSGCYDSPPYMLLNYHGDSLHDVFTLAHEAGHSMHSYFSMKHQPYQDHSYGIFVAEVASTFNEQLLAHFLESRTTDKRLLAYLLNEQIDDIRSTLFRQTMFAEFEDVIHRRAEKNESLTVDDYGLLYRNLLEKYGGPDVHFDPLNNLEYLRIPHFYSRFYVYKYATGVSAAIALSERVLHGGEAEREEYLCFLKAGCSKYPLEVLRDAGVNMLTPEPIEAAIKKFDVLVGRLEQLLT